MPPESALRPDLPSAAAAGAAATAFLLAAQSADRSWRDFLLPAGESTLWVTAFVAGVLAGRQEPAPRRAALSAWRMLAETPAAGGGWSYNAAVPGDADSTLWALRLAEALGEGRSDAAKAGGAFLQLCRRPDGGLATYPSDAAIRTYIGAPSAVPFHGWTQPHVCVSAAGANLAAARDAGPAYLLATQSQDGAWASYWWFDDAFATAEAVTALVQVPGVIDAGGRAAIARAVRWARDQAEALLAGPASPRPPAFALALLVRVLARGGEAPETRRILRAAVDRLVGWQAADGSFPPSARLRVPPPDCMTPADGPAWRAWTGLPQGLASPAQMLAATFNIYSLDHRRLYTTATVLRALDEAAEALADA